MLQTTTLSTMVLPVATAAFAADWIVTPRVLEAEVGPLDAKGGWGVEDVNVQAGVGAEQCDGPEDGVLRGLTSCRRYVRGP